MKNLLKFIFKIIYSPIWLLALIIVILVNGFCLSFDCESPFKINGRDLELKDYFGYWWR